MCSEREKKNWRCCCDLNWCTVSNKTTKQQKSNNGVTQHRVSSIFFLFFCLQLSPRFNNTTLLKGIVQKSQHVRHDKANTLLFIILFPLSPLSSLSISFSVVVRFVFFPPSTCSKHCDLQDQPGKTPLHKHLSLIRSPLGNGADSVSWCFSDAARTRVLLSRRTESRNSYGWFCENAATAAFGGFSWSKEKKSDLHIIQWNRSLHLCPSQCIVWVNRCFFFFVKTLLYKNMRILRCPTEEEILLY